MGGSRLLVAELDEPPGDHLGGVQPAGTGGPLGQRERGLVGHGGDGLEVVLAVELAQLVPALEGAQGAGGRAEAGLAAAPDLEGRGSLVVGLARGTDRGLGADQLQRVRGVADLPPVDIGEEGLGLVDVLGGVPPEDPLGVLGRARGRRRRELVDPGDEVLVVGPLGHGHRQADRLGVGLQAHGRPGLLDGLVELAEGQVRPGAQAVPGGAEGRLGDPGQQAQPLLELSPRQHEQAGLGEDRPLADGAALVGQGRQRVQTHAAHDRAGGALALGLRSILVDGGQWGSLSSSGRGVAAGQRLTWVVGSP